MKKEKIDHIVNHIDDRFINEAATYKPVRDSRKSIIVPQFRWAIVTLCLIIVIVIGFTAWKVSAEKREYNIAIDFFEDNGLSTDDLTSEEIVEIYRDITTGKFTYNKTIEVLRKTVSGWEIPQVNPTPEEIAAVWDKNTAILLRISKDYACIFDNTIGSDDERYSFSEKSTVNCFYNKKLLWTITIPDYSVDRSLHIKQGTILFGNKWSNMADIEIPDSYIPWVALVGDDGTIIWANDYFEGHNDEHIDSVVNMGNGTIAVFSVADNNIMCIRYIDTERQTSSYHQTKTDYQYLHILNAARFGEGFIIQVNRSKFNLIDYEGNIYDTLSYRDDKYVYNFTDMIEFQGHLYLSAYTHPKSDDCNLGREGGYAIKYMLDKILSGEKSSGEFTSEELTPLIRDSYTAVLLVCDLKDGIPEVFYTVNGSKGGKLSVNNMGELQWNVESITTGYEAIYSNSHTFYGTCKVFRYTFDENGKLLNQEETGEITGYAA